MSNENMSKTKQKFEGNFNSYVYACVNFWHFSGLDKAIFENRFIIMRKKYYFISDV